METETNHATQNARPDEEFMRRVPHDFAREHLVLWVSGEDGKVVALHANDSSPAAMHNLSVLLQRWPEPECAEHSELAALIDEAYAKAIEHHEDGAEEHIELGEVDEVIDRLVHASEADLLSTSGKSPIVRLIDGLLFEGIRRGASDIHFQPTAEHLLVRFRIDGALIDARSLPARIAPPVASRVKVMGHMDIAETRVPQDGRASVTIGKGDGTNRHEIDLRISTLPTSDGERVVIRFLDSNQGQRLATLDAIGMPGDILARYRAAASRPNGIILLTGPTGSGKTTTLYATLRELASTGGAIGGGELNIMTIEDPIECRLNASGLSISQSQVNRKKGMTFASGLRHILRQDPDVVMVGEIRDAETAQIAIQSSLTGHLVFSTLHTNDSVSAPPRLIDLGIEPYLISASLSAVLAQRLVRTLHQACNGEGCESCMKTGYAGRTGIFELLRMTEPVRELISHSAAASRLRDQAKHDGWRSLREDGQRLINLGLTTQTEIERVAVDLGEEQVV
ncbi:MAG: type II secretion system protein GspE [Phycisphaerae bacterium]|nr:type II secretion system protein GspE [Phycisphaerae bacterium]MBM92254.1 type II secretion system protein GspE [Phycisphaerae bacterium]